MSFITRRNKLRKLIHKAKADALLVTSFTNVTYLTGFTGEDSFLFVTLEGETLISDSRFTEQLQQECPGLKLKIRSQTEQMIPTVAKLARRAKVKRLGVEAGSATLGLSQALSIELPNAEQMPTDGLVEELRILKDKSEIEATRLACRHAQRAFDAVRALIQPKMTEKDVAAELEYQARRFGAISMSFPPIVAVGPRSALPHANPTSRRLGESDFTLIDWGTCSDHYMSDLTRIVVTGKISPKLRKVYGVVLKAQQAGIDAIRPGVTGDEVDRVARKVISKAGYGDAFNHGLGHGTGLEIHEAPRLSPGRQTKLRPGMIVTVEPGIYLPGWGGVRIEDDILVTRTGHEVLTNVPKQFDDCILS